MRLSLFEGILWGLGLLIIAFPYTTPDSIIIYNQTTFCSLL